VSDPFGEVEEEVYSPNSGIVIGQMCLPLVNEGEAIFHIAKFARSDLAEGNVGEFHEEMQNDSNLMYSSEDIPNV